MCNDRYNKEVHMLQVLVQSAIRQARQKSLPPQKVQEDANLYSKDVAGFLIFLLVVMVFALIGVYSDQ
jgi:hypothetical protein